MTEPPTTADVVDQSAPRKRGHLGILQPDDYYGEVTGTVVMMASHNDDEDGNKEDDGLKRTDKGIVLEPQPQNDPNDPLNWPIWRRDLALLVIGFHSFIIGGQTPILATAFTSMSEEFGVTESKLAYLVGAYMLVLGFGSVFFAPTAILYSKRLVYLIALVIWIAGAVMAGAAKSYNVLLGARIIMGFGGSPTEALPSASIAEIYFLHERAYRLGIYTLLLLGGKNLVPMVAGFIISEKGWNWLYWIQAIIVGFNLVMTFFFVPDTFWIRPAVPHDKRSIRETELAREARANSLRSIESANRSARLTMSEKGTPAPETAPTNGESSSTTPNTATGTSTPEKPGKDESLNPPKRESETDAKQTEGDDTVDHGQFAEFSTNGEDEPAPRKSMVRHPTFQEPPQHELHPHDTGPRPTLYSRSEMASTMSVQNRYLRHNIPELPRTLSTSSVNNKPKTYLETLKPYTGRLSKDKWWMIAVRPFVLLAYPPVLFSMFIYAFSVVWLIVISEVVSALFTPDPYGFPATSVGLLYISIFLGGCLGSAIAGRASDIIVRVMSRKNHGTYEPEFRLVMILPVFISVTMGMMGFGWATFDKDHWIVPTIFLGILGFGCSLGSTTAITYAVDSYKMFASEALVTLNLAKNTFGFLFSLFVPKFVDTSGAKNAFVVFGSCQIFMCLFAIPLYIYGKRVRHWTDNKNMMRHFYVEE